MPALLAQERAELRLRPRQAQCGGSGPELRDAQIHHYQQQSEFAFYSACTSNARRITSHLHANCRLLFYSPFYLPRRFAPHWTSPRRSSQLKTSQELTQYHFLVWRNGVVPESSLPLLGLIDVALANNAGSRSPIVVHCSGGGDRSSVFVTLAALIEQVRAEERVDVFQSARYTRSQRQTQLQTIVSIAWRISWRPGWRPFHLPLICCESSRMQGAQIASDRFSVLGLARLPATKPFVNRLPL